MTGTNSWQDLLPLLTSPSLFSPFHSSDVMHPTARETLAHAPVARSEEGQMQADVSLSPCLHLLFSHSLAITRAALQLMHLSCCC